MAVTVLACREVGTAFAAREARIRQSAAAEVADAVRFGVLKPLFLAGSRREDLGDACATHPVMPIIHTVDEGLGGALGIAPVALPSIRQRHSWSSDGLAVRQTMRGGGLVATIGWKSV